MIRPRSHVPVSLVAALVLLSLSLIWSPAFAAPHPHSAPPAAVRASYGYGFGYDLTVGPMAPMSDFSFDTLFPDTPANATVSRYGLSQELLAWTDTTLFFVASSLLKEIAPSSSSPSSSVIDADPAVVFVPTNGAFIHLIDELFPWLIAVLSSSYDTSLAQQIAAFQNLITPLMAALKSKPEDLAKFTQGLQMLIDYHVVPRQSAATVYDEFALRRMASVTTGLKLSVDTQRFPQIVDVAGRKATRYGRMIAGPVTNVVVIDKVLLPAPVSVIRAMLPIDLSTFITTRVQPHLARMALVAPTVHQAVDDWYSPSEEPDFGPYSSHEYMPDYPDYDSRMTDGAPYAPPLYSYRDFISARTDLVILNAIIRLFPDLDNLLYSVNRNVHLVAPNNQAFIKLLVSLLPSLNPAQLVLDLENIDVSNPGDVSFGGLETLLREAIDAIALLSSSPSLPEIVQYHVLQGSALLESRVDAGPQGTVYNPDVPVHVSRVDDWIVLRDLDESRGDAHVIETVGTQHGYVSVIDTVLTPFSLSERDTGGLGEEPDDGYEGEPTEEPEVEAKEVKTDGSLNASGSENGECFPADARIALADGSQVEMRALSAGHTVRVHALRRDMSSRIFLFTHRAPHGVHEFVRLQTAHGHVLRLSAGHYLYVRGRLRAARAVRVGDVLQTITGLSRVKRVSRVRAAGLYAPHSMHGDLVVDGVLVSTYSTALHPRWAHALLAPVRLVAQMGGVVEPLGGLLYNGADHLVGLLPVGRDVY